MRLKDNFIILVTGLCLTLTGCLEMELKVQPHYTEVGSTFSAVTEVVQTGNDGDRAMLFAVHKPTEWTINSVTFTSPEQGDGTFSYLGNETDATLAGAGGIDVGWEDSVQAAHPADSMMHWQMYLSDGVAGSSASEENPDTFHVTVNYTVGSSEGHYGLKYWVSYDNNGEHTSESGTASDGAPVVAYDPALSPLVTFTVDEGTWMREDIRVKGAMSNWKTFQAYDDGTNGDATADDHVWTAHYPVITDGTYGWGAIDTENADGTLCHACDDSDGTGYGTWLGGGPDFTVSGTTVTGSTNLAVAPDSAVSEGVVELTFYDDYGMYTHIAVKGNYSDWAVQDMFDDGTNGDETAGDSVWTAHVAVAPGTHGWGVIDRLNPEGVPCTVCDGDDPNGQGAWLIEGDNPQFTLDDDQLTLHGQTHYDKLVPDGDPITKTVLFSVDMTEWLDEEGNMGMRAFNIGNGDTMEVRGSFNDWGSCENCQMTRTPGTNIFSHAIEVTGLPDSEHSYAYYMGLSQASLEALADRFQSYDSDGLPAIVDWIGWETSPIHKGNRKFNLGEDDETGLLELPLYSFYDAFPGSVIPEGQSVELTLTVDMTTGTNDFDAAEDTVGIRTGDKWMNLAQGFSDGQDLNHYPATPNGDGTYDFTVTFHGPAMWQVYYRWAYYDVSLGSDVEEAGGGLGGHPRIRYIHQDADNNCEWPSSFSFDLDDTFALDEDDVVAEDWDSSSICMSMVSIGDADQSAVPNSFNISDNFPNPFNPTTQVDITLPEESDIIFNVYSITGVEIYSYKQNAVSSGSYRLTWNGKDRNGMSVPSGVYLYEFRAGNKFHQTKKMTLLK